MWQLPLFIKLTELKKKLKYQQNIQVLNFGDFNYGKFIKTIAEIGQNYFPETMNSYMVLVRIWEYEYVWHIFVFRKMKTNNMKNLCIIHFKLAHIFFKLENKMFLPIWKIIYNYKFIVRIILNTYFIEMFPFWNTSPSTTITFNFDV